MVITTHPLATAKWWQSATPNWEANPPGSVRRADQEVPPAARTLPTDLVADLVADLPARIPVGSRS
jgi:hypothetical protein